MSKSRYFWGGIVTGLLVAAAMMLLIFAGSSVVSLITGKNPVSGTVLDREVQTKLDMLNSVIDKNYMEYSEDLPSTSREEGLYKGLVESLGDPYSQYFTSEEFNAEKEEDSGQFGGIGVSITTNKDTGAFYAAEFIGDDSPAKAAGMKVNDIFYEVDGLPIQDMTLSELVSHCRGEVGTDVELVMLRGEQGEQVHLKITRAVIENRSVSSNMLEDGIGYIRISEFVQNTPDQFVSNLEELKGDGLNKLILDLRSNPGGDVSAVLKVADEIMESGRIVYTKNKAGDEKDYDATSERSLKMPLVVLVNGYSASASEILTGAIKDHGLGTIMGTKTYGKGIVQAIYPLNDGSAIKLTDRKYFTPSGNNIQGLGIEPDIEVEFDADAFEDNGTDNQLEEAKKYIKSK